MVMWTDEHAISGESALKQVMALLICSCAGCSFYDQIPMWDARITLETYEQIPLGCKWQVPVVPTFIPAGQAGAVYYEKLLNGGYAFISVVTDREGKVASKAMVFGRQPGSGAVVWACAFHYRPECTASASRPTFQTAPTTSSAASSDQDKTPLTDDSIWSLVYRWTQPEDLKEISPPLTGMLLAHAGVIRRSMQSFPKPWQEGLGEIAEKYFEEYPSLSDFSWAFVLERMNQRFGGAIDRWPNEVSGSGLSSEGWPHREWWWFRRPDRPVLSLLYAHLPPSAEPSARSTGAEPERCTNPNMSSDGELKGASRNKPDPKQKENPQGSHTVQIQPNPIEFLQQWQQSVRNGDLAAVCGRLEPEMAGVLKAFDGASRQYLQELRTMVNLIKRRFVIPPNAEPEKIYTDAETFVKMLWEMVWSTMSLGHDPASEKNLEIRWDQLWVDGRGGNWIILQDGTQVPWQMRLKKVNNRWCVDSSEKAAWGHWRGLGGMVCTFAYAHRFWAELVQAINERKVKTIEEFWAYYNEVGPRLFEPAVGWERESSRE